MKLLSKSQDHSKRDEYFPAMVHYYEALDTIPQVHPILKITAKSYETNIHFDFNNAGVSRYFPLEKNSLGKFVSSGDIHNCYIGAKRNELEVLATLAHELTHCALQLAYKNDSKPYSTLTETGTLQMEIYQEIVRTYITLEHGYSEVKEVYYLYEPHTWEAELIVRVPQLLALLKDEPWKARIFEFRLKKLYRFFVDKVIKDIEKILKIEDIEDD